MNGVERDQLLGIAQNISAYIKLKTTHNGFVTASFDAASGNIMDYNVNPDDVADYLLFMVWLGKLSNDAPLLDWCNSQFELQKKTLQMPSGLYISNFKAGSKPMIGLFSSANVRYQADFLIGAIPLYRLTGKLVYLEAARKFADGLVEHALDKKGFVCDRVVPTLKLKYPKSSSESSGLFIEGLIDLYKVTQDEKYISAACRIAEAWIDTPIFKKHKIFTDRWNTLLNKPAGNFFGRNSYRCRLMKSNTNMLFGLMALYGETEDPKLADSIHSWFAKPKMEFRPGVFYNSWDVVKEKHDGIVDKTSNHAVLDVLLEAHRVFKDREYLNRAISGGEFWLENRLSTGLISDRPLGKKIIDVAGPEPLGHVSMIDSHVDLSVIFLKLYHATGEKKFLDAGFSGIDTLKYFKQFGTYAGWVDPESGRVISTKNKTKFLGGCIKLLLVAYFTAKGGNVYKDELFRLLARDR